MRSLQERGAGSSERFSSRRFRCSRRFSIGARGPPGPSRGPRACSHRRVAFVRLDGNHGRHSFGARLEDGHIRSEPLRCSGAFAPVCERDDVQCYFAKRRATFDFPKGISDSFCSKNFLDLLVPKRRRRRSRQIVPPLFFEHCGLAGPEFVESEPDDGIRSPRSWSRDNRVRGRAQHSRFDALCRDACRCGERRGWRERWCWTSKRTLCRENGRDAAHDRCDQHRQRQPQSALLHAVAPKSSDGQIALEGSGSSPPSARVELIHFCGHFFPLQGEGVHHVSTESPIHA